MLPDYNSFAISPEKEHRVSEVQMLIHILFSRQVKQDVIRLRMQDVDSVIACIQKEWKGLKSRKSSDLLESMDSWKVKGFLGQTLHL